MHPVELVITIIAVAACLLLLVLLHASSRRVRAAQSTGARAAGDPTNQERLRETLKAELMTQVSAELEARQQGQQALVAQSRETLARELAGIQAEAQARIQALERAQGLRHQAQEDAIASAKQGLERERTALAQELERRDQQAVHLQEREQAVTGRERALLSREDSIDRKLEALDQRDTRMREREQAVEARLQAISVQAQQAQALLDSAQARLEAVAGLSPEEARAELMHQLEGSLKTEQEARIARHEKELALRAKELSIEVVSRAIQRYAAEHTAESTTAKIQLKDEEFKGRIIGKEGRNIKAFEQATGVDVIIEEGQPVITISCFDPVRRELARRTLEALLEDGRIHPARIEEVLVRMQQELDAEILRLGEDAAFQVEVSGLHPQLVRLLGKLHFRTSYGQNVLKHTQEVAFLCGAMASDLGLDPKLGRRCGLLHDIGKAIDHEQEGSHPQLGYQALKRYGEPELVANAALAHHEGHEVLSAYTVLAAAADAISAARPGARSESSERYLKRLQQLEDIACSFSGVQKAYAIQAGRELRVIINGHTLADQELPRVAREIARRIEDEVRFPGEVKVTCIRETRQTAVAR